MLEVEPGRVKMIAPSAIEVWSSLPSREYSLTAFRLGADTVSWLPSRTMLHDVAVGVAIPVRVVEAVAKAVARFLMVAESMRQRLVSSACSSTWVRLMVSIRAKSCSI